MGIDSGILEMPKSKNVDRAVAPQNFEEQLRDGYYANILLEGYMGENTWTREHVARDILQNFFDANGQTLDGIEISVQEHADDIEITIHGAQTYPYRRLISLGGGYKNDKDRAAGGKHQGTKDVAVMLLREYGVDAMEFSSEDWKLTFSAQDAPQELQGDGDKKQRGLFMKLDDHEHRAPGNTLRFMTHDKAMAQAVFAARDLFFHQANPDLQHPDIDNDYAGFRILEQGQKGNMYLNGQRISYEEKGQWNTVPGFTFWSKISPHVGNKSITLSRDRELITHQDLQEVYIPFLVESISREERELALFALEPYFEKQDFDFSRRVGQDLLIRLLVALKKDGFRTTFGDRYFADDTSGKGASEVLKGRGFILCLPELADIGMRRASDHFKLIEADQEIKPSQEERERLTLIESVGRKFLETHGETLGLSPKSIRLFVSEHPALGGQYDTQGLWITRQKIRGYDAYATLTTYFHELCHKFGTDQSAEFSYKLTDLLREWMHYCAKNSTELSTLQRDWSRITIDQSWKTLEEFEFSAAPLIAQHRSHDATGYTEQYLESHRVKIDRMAAALINIVEKKFDGIFNRHTLKQIWGAIQNHAAVRTFRAHERATSSPEYHNGLEAVNEEKRQLNSKIWRKRNALARFEQQQHELEKPGKSVQKRGKKGAIQEIEQQISDLQIEIDELVSTYMALEQRFPSGIVLEANDRALINGELLGVRCDIFNFLSEELVLSAWNRVLLEKLDSNGPNHDATKRISDEMQHAALFFREQIGEDVKLPYWRQHRLVMELECALRNAQKDPTRTNILAGQVLHDQIEYLTGKMKTMHENR